LNQNTYILAKEFYKIESKDILAEIKKLKKANTIVSIAKAKKLRAEIRTEIA